MTTWLTLFHSYSHPVCVLARLLAASQSASSLLCHPILLFKILTPSPSPPPPPPPPPCFSPTGLSSCSLSLSLVQIAAGGQWRQMKTARRLQGETKIERAGRDSLVKGLTISGFPCSVSTLSKKNIIGWAPPTPRSSRLFGPSTQRVAERKKEKKPGAINHRVRAARSAAEIASQSS